jgi:hypothetical protein
MRSVQLPGTADCTPKRLSDLKNLPGKANSLGLAPLLERCVATTHHEGPIIVAWVILCSLRVGLGKTDGEG